MEKDEKLSGKYYKLAVHVVGKPDCNNYTYSSKDVKQLFTTEAGETTYTYLHGGFPLKDVTTVANYISEVDNIFNENKKCEQLIPKGSHIKIIHSTNELLNNAINNKIVRAVSSEQEPNLKKSCSANTKKLIEGKIKNGKVTPHDIEDMECTKYNTLAFVEEGCNGIEIEELDYNFYIENHLNYNKLKEDKTMEKDLTKEDLGVLSSVLKMMNFKPNTSESITPSEVQKLAVDAVQAELAKQEQDDEVKNEIETTIDEKLSVYNEKIDTIIEKFEEPKAWLSSVTDKAFWDKMMAQEEEHIAEKTEDVATKTLNILNEKEQEELIKQLKAEGYEVEKPKPEIEDAKSKLEEMGYNITIKNENPKEKKEEEKEELKLQLDNPKDIVITNTAREVRQKPSTFANYE